MNYHPRCFGILTAFALIAANSAQASTATWNSSSGSSWNTAANWTGATGGTGTKPTSADDVVFDNRNVTIPTVAGIPTISLDGNQVANSLTIGSSNGAPLSGFNLQADSTGSVTTARTATLTSGSITMDSSLTGAVTIGANSGTNGALSISTASNGAYTIQNNNTSQTLNISAILLKSGTTNNASFNSAGGLIILGGLNTAAGTSTIGNGLNNTVVQLANVGALKSFTNNTVNAGSTVDLNGLALTATAFTLNGAGSVSGVDAGALVNSTGAATNAGAITLGSASTIKNSGTSLVLSGAVTNGGFALTVDGTSATTLGTGIMSGTGGVVKNGSGTLTLSGANTFSGGVAINVGTVTAGSTAAVGSGTVTIGSTGNSAVLDLGGKTLTVAGLATAGTAGNQTIGNSSTTTAGVVSYTSTGTSTFGGVIQDSVGGGTQTTGFTAKGVGGDLTLTASNSFTGGLTVAAGIVRAGNANAFGNGTVTVGSTGNSATLDLNGQSENIYGLAAAGTAANQTIGNSSTSSTATLNYIGAGNSTFTGSVMDTVGSGNKTTAVVMNSATATLTLSGGGSNYSGGTTVNNGDLILTGINAAAQTVTLNSGTLNIGNASALASGSTLVINGGVLDSGANITEAGPTTVTLGGDFAWTGSGALNLNGNISLTSSRTINAEGLNTGIVTLANGSGNTLSAGTAGLKTITITGSGNVGLGGTATGSVTTASVLSDGSGQLGLIMAGTGTLVMGGANTFTGGILVKSGTLQKNGSSPGTATAFGAGTITLGDTTGTATASIQYTNLSSSAVFANAITVQAGSSGTKTIYNVGGNFTSIIGGLLTLNDNVTINYNGGMGGLVTLGNSTTGTWVTGTGTIVSMSNATGGVENSITGNNASFTGGVVVETGGFKVLSATALSAANAVTVYSGADFDLVSSSATIGGLNDNAGSGGIVTDTGTTVGAKTLTLAGSGTYSFAGAVTSTITSNVAVNVSMGSGGVQTLAGINTYTGATTVGGGKLNLTGSLAGAATVGNNTSNTAILSGTGTVSGALSTVTTGSNIAYIAPGVNTSGARNDFGSAGTLHVGSAGFSVGANTQFDFDLSTTAAGSNDLISMSGGTLSIGGTGIVFNFNQSGLQTGTAYTLISGATSLSGFSASDFSALGIGSDTATFSSTGTALQVTFSSVSGVTSGTYTLTTTAGASILHATGTTTLTTTLANTGTSGQDALAYSGVGAGASSGTVSGTTVSGTVTIGNNAVNSSQTFVAGSGSGTATITPTGTISNATASGSPSGTTAGTTVVVYTGQGVWNTNGSGTWGAVQATPTNWTAGGGTPGLDSNFKTTDSASFGSVTTSGTATITLGSDSPFLNAVTFNDSAASYDIERGGTGVLHLDSATTAAITDSAGNHKIGAPMEFDSAVSTTVATSSTMTLAGNITESGSRSLTVNGPGTTVLSGSNNYSGGTTVVSGQLLANNAGGSATGSGALVVNAGAALGGTGAIHASSFAIGGTGSPTTVTVGNGTDTTSGLTLTGSGSNTITNTQLNFNISAATAGQGNTLSVGTSTITFGSTTLALNVTGTGIIPSYTPYVLIAGSGSNQYGGLATNIEVINGTSYDVITGGLSLSFAPALANSWYAGHSFLYIDTTNGVDDIDVSVVPEPGTWALMLGGLAALLFWQRRKKSV
jgi:fibronectin-binding autotransporter adhesin